MYVRNEKNLFYAKLDETRNDRYLIYMKEDMEIKPGLKTVFSGLSIEEIKDLELYFVMDKMLDYDNIFLSLSTSIYKKTNCGNELRFDFINYGSTPIILKKDTVVSCIQFAYCNDGRIDDDELYADLIYKDEEVVAKSFVGQKNYEIVIEPDGKKYLKIGLN